MFQATPMPILKSTPLTFRSSKLRLGKSRRPLWCKADAKACRYQRDQRKSIITTIGDVADKIVLGKHFGKVSLGVGQVLARKRDDLLIAQVLDADLG